MDLEDAVVGHCVGAGHVGVDVAVVRDVVLDVFLQMPLKVRRGKLG